MANFKFYDDYQSGKPPLIIEAPVAAGQSLEVGDAVVLSSGQVTKAAAPMGSVFGIMAEASDSAAAGTSVQVYLVTPFQRWRATADADASGALLQSKLHDIDASQQVAVADIVGGSMFIWDTLDSNTDVLVSFTVQDYRA